MTELRSRRKLAGILAFLAVLAIAGVAVAGSAPATPASSHASSTAVTHATSADLGAPDEGEQDDPGSPDVQNHGDLLSAAAQSDLTGGPHDNHGGYVSCIARGGSECTSANPIIPSHSQAGAPSQASKHRQNGQH